MLNLKIACRTADVSACPRQILYAHHRKDRVFLCGPSCRDVESMAGEMPEMKGNEKNKLIPKKQSIWVWSLRSCSGEGSSSEAECVGKRTASQQLKPLGTMTTCFGKFWVKSFVSLLFCGCVYAYAGNAVLLHQPHLPIYRFIFLIKIIE